jgi:hypothetical protein
MLRQTQNITGAVGKDSPALAMTSKTRFPVRLAGRAIPPPSTQNRGSKFSAPFLNDP